MQANEPHPGCTFHLHGFGFDANSSGRWHIEGQGGNGGPDVRDGAWGPANSSGDWRTAVMTLAPGHYKAEAWQTLPNDPNGGAKQKVFWVECGPPGGQEAEQARTNLSSAITNAQTINGQILADIAIAQQLQLLGQLSAAGQAALQNAINARALLQTRLTEAQTALNALTSAINSGTPAEIAVAVGNAVTATTNLNTAASGAASANLALGTQVSAAGAAAQAHAALAAAISNAQTLANQLVPLITAAQQLLPSLTAGQQAALNTALQGAISASNLLGTRLTEAQTAMNALNTAISSGNAGQIAVAVSGANQAAMRRADHSLGRHRREHHEREHHDRRGPDCDEYRSEHVTRERAITRGRPAERRGQHGRERTGASHDTVCSEHWRLTEHPDPPLDEHRRQWAARGSRRDARSSRSVPAQQAESHLVGRLSQAQPRADRGGSERSSLFP